MGSDYYGYQLVRWASNALPAGASLCLADGFAHFQWQRRTQARAQVARNLSLVLDQAVEPHSPLVYEVFRSFAWYLVEFFAMHRHRPSVNIEGEAHLQRLASQGQGVIVLTTHLGNWELGAVMLNRLGHPLTGLVRPHADARLNALFVAQRRRCGLETFPLGTHALREALHILQRRRWLGLIADRDFTGHGVAVAWGSHRVVLPNGPALLSLQTQAPILPVAFVREGPWRFRLLVDPPIFPPAVRRHRAAIAALTQRCTDVLRVHIRRFAGQWAMFKPLPEVA